MALMCPNDRGRRRPAHAGIRQGRRRRRRLTAEAAASCRQVRGGLPTPDSVLGRQDARSACGHRPPLRPAGRPSWAGAAAGRDRDPRGQPATGGHHLGAVLDVVSADLGISGWLAGVLTTLPVLSFAAVGSLTHLFTSRFGLHRSALLALAAICAGSGTRARPDSPALIMACTTVALAGMAVGLIFSLLPLVSRALPRPHPHRDRCLLQRAAGRRSRCRRASRCPSPRPPVAGCGVSGSGPSRPGWRRCRGSALLRHDVRESARHLPAAHLAPPGALAAGLDHGPVLRCPVRAGVRAVRLDASDHLTRG